MFRAGIETNRSTTHLCKYIITPTFRHLVPCNRRRAYPHSYSVADADKFMMDKPNYTATPGIAPKTKR